MRRRIFHSDYILLGRASPVRPGKRFVSFLIDFIVVFAVSYFIFLAAFEITKTTGTYSDANRAVADEIAYYAEFASDSHIVEYVDDAKTERKDADIIVLENCNRAIYRSFLFFGNEQEPDFVISSEHAAAQFGEASADTDTISYFYLRYIPSSADRQIVSYGTKDAQTYLFDKYKVAFAQSSTMFTFDPANSEIPTLNTQSAYALFHYLYESSEDTLGQTGSSLYSSFYSAYAFLLEEAEELLIKSEPYYSEHYKKYQSSYYLQGRCIVATLCASVAVGYCIGILLPKLLFKDERTIGRKIMKQGVITREKEKVRWHMTLSYSVLGIVGYMSTMILMFVFPPFKGNYDVLMMPLFNDASAVSMSLVIVIIAMVAAANAVFSLFTHYKTCIADALLRCRVVDAHYLDEGDFDERTEGKGD